jgi:RNA polymerase primary sigma factor
MKERDVYEAIIEIGKRRGTVTYDEINEALPPEFFSLEELEKFLRYLLGMGVRLTPRAAVRS